MFRPMAKITTALVVAAALSLAGGTAFAQIPRPHAQPQHAPARVPHWTIPSDARIRAVLADAVDRRHVALGMVVGIIEPGGRRIIVYGRRDVGDPRPLDGDTLFEMGSITKLFTTLALTDMVQRGEVRLDEPADNLAPPGMSFPEFGGRKITLLDLATHTSGLPNFPYNLASKSPLNPFAGYSEDRLAAFLTSYRLPRRPGAAWDYSSLGVGLLGDLLARREDTGYEVLVKSRVLNPLGMTSTTVTLTPEEARRLAPGHTESFARAATWDFPMFEGAAGLKSSANDMLTFLAANLGYVKTPLTRQMHAMLAVQRPTDWPTDAQAIGWLVSQTAMGEVVHHEGETAGYRTYVAFDPVRRTGIVVLANVATNADLGNIGDSLLIGAIRS